MKTPYDIVLIVPNPSTTKGINDTTHEQLLGILYIGTVLKKNGFKCKIIDAKVLGLSNKNIIKRLKYYNPKLVGITFVSAYYKSIKDLCNKIKNLNENIKIVLGGPHPTTLPNETLKSFNADAVVIGEGEETFLEIAQKIKNKKLLFNGIKGVGYKNNNKIKINLPRPNNQNIDLLPFPDYSMLPNPLKYKRRTKRIPAAPILTSRGCPFRCTFCSRDIFKNKVTFRSPENVIEEIEYLINKFNFKQIDIIDDNFLINKERAKQILKLIIKKKINLAINLQSGVRVNSIDEELLRLMKKAGVYRVAFGIESGDEGILKNIKKDIKLSEVKKAVKLTKQVGLRVDCFFMIGLPGDNPKTMQKTIDFAKSLKPNTATFSITLPFPGTELYDEVKQKGHLFVDARYGLDWGFNAAKVNYLLPGMNKKQIYYFYKKAYNDFYLRPSQIFRMLIDVKSIQELKWLINTGVSIFKNVLFK